MNELESALAQKFINSTANDKTLFAMDLTALMAVVATICGLCIEVPEVAKPYIKMGAGVILFPVWTVLGAVAAFLFRKAK